MVVVRRKTDGKFFKRGQIRTHLGSSWVEDVNEATTYRNPGAALNSVGNLTKVERGDHISYTPPKRLSDGLEIVLVTLTIVQESNQC